MKKKLPNPTDVHVGSRARMRRLMLDLSQTDLANALEVTFQPSSKIREGSKPDQRKPFATNVKLSASTNPLFL